MPFPPAFLPGHSSRALTKDTIPRMLQLFVDVNVRNSVSDVYPFTRTFQEAHACRLGAPRQQFFIHTAVRLRRVSWQIDPGVECACTLVQGGCEYSVRVAARGRGSMEWTGDLSLHVIEAGWRLAWEVTPMGLDGRATFSFEFEAVDRAFG